MEVEKVDRKIDDSCRQTYNIDFCSLLLLLSRDFLLIELPTFCSLWMIRLQPTHDKYLIRDCRQLRKVWPLVRWLQQGSAPIWSEVGSGRALPLPEEIVGGRGKGRHQWKKNVFFQALPE